MHRIEQILRWEAKIEDQVSHWIFPNNTSLLVLEQMLLQYLQGLGKIKEQQAQAALDAQKAKEAEASIPVPEVHQEHVEQPAEEVHVI